MKSYRLFLSREVYEFLDDLSKRSRVKLGKTLFEIGDDPIRHTSSNTYNPEGRLLHIHRMKTMQIIYWIDDADRHIKIMEIVKL